MRQNYGSKWEPDWVRHYSGGQTDYSESLDNCCHVISVLKTLHSKGNVIIIAFFFERELCWAWNCWREMGTWWKTSQTVEKDWKEKPEDHWKHSSPVGKLMSLKESCCWWKISQSNDGKNEEENWTRDQLIKNLPTNKENWRGKPKDHRV